MKVSIDYGQLATIILTHGAKILLILVAVVVAQVVLKRALPRILALSEKRAGERQDEFKKRVQTLGSVIANAVTVVLTVIGGLMVLSEVGIDIFPLLTGAGLVGLAFGFGAQNLVRDVIAGFFVLLENQYRKGDVVKIAGVEGLVEDVNLRRTILRDLDGAVHSIPNGEIKVASNYSLGYSRVNLNVPIAYESDLEKAIDILNKIGKEMAVDKKFGELIIKPPQVLGVESFGELGIAVKFFGETKPIKQWEVTRELRKRIKGAFDSDGIKIPHTKSA